MESTPDPAPPPPTPHSARFASLTPRRDVRLVSRGEHLYFCASTETLRVPAGVPAPRGTEHSLLGLDAVPDRVIDGMRTRGLVHPGDGRHPHPLYGREHERSKLVVTLAADGLVATEAAGLLTRAG